MDAVVTAEAVTVTNNSTATLGQVLSSNGDGTATYQNPAAGTPASTVSPASDDGTGAIGTSTDYARADHKHPLPTLNDGQVFVGNGSNVPTGVTVSGDATIDNTGALTLANSGVTAGTTGSTTQVAQVTVDAKGRVTAITAVNIKGILTDVAGTVSSNNIDINWNEHTYVTAAATSDTVTLQISTGASVGDTLEFYNASSSQMIVAINGADAFLGSPGTNVPANTGFTARIVAANTIEVVGTQ